MEFALIAPSLVLIVVGILEFGVFFWKKHSIEFAVEETSRAVMMKTAVAEADVVTDLNSRLLGIDPADIAATVVKETIGVTTYVSIGVTYNYTFVVGGYFGFTPILIESKTRFPLNPPE